MFSEFFLFQMAEIMLRLYRNGKRKNDQTETVPSNTIVYSYVRINKQSIYIYSFFFFFPFVSKSQAIIIGRMIQRGRNTSQ